MSSNQVPEQAPPDVRIIRSAERSTWRDSALLSRQSFPATGNFDMEGNAFGLLMVHNDDVVAPGEGFDMHEHRNVELVTWVMDGALRHRDDGGSITGAAGAEATLEPGMAQHISAGRGIRHSELNASGYLAGKKLRVIQAWLPPTTADTEPRHSETDLTEALSDGLLHPVASGTPDRAPLTIGTEGVTLWAGRIPAGRAADVPVDAFVHLYVAAGTAELHGLPDAGPPESPAETPGASTSEAPTESPAATPSTTTVVLEEGDVARLTGFAAAPSLTATTDTEVLIWVMDRGIG
ncbi:pirin family protein [uncultured Corynebacterium sp.]|uniref:pirin family protein n=1 Tax=uncultured Corynebacterium sp. TaxID=159447 RepID=UPI0026113461|nr:pirin family protein [uncultured Corynebacterium sp.]